MVSGPQPGVVVNVNGWKSEAFFTLAIAHRPKEISDDDVDGGLWVVTIFGAQ